MKIYDFTVRKKYYERVVFALALDKKRLTERIIIGETGQVRRSLEHGDGDVYYDVTRPLGTLLFNFAGDTTGEWNKHGIILRDSYAKFLPFTSSRWNEAAPAVEFLTAKYKSGEPFSVFAAVRTWEDYLSCFNMPLATDTLSKRLHTLYKPFTVYEKYRPWDKEAAYALANDMTDGDLQIELWYPAAKRPFETIAAVSSFMSVISYYTHKIAEWGYFYHVCKVCGKDYLAKNRHYEICSDECRKVQAVIAKQEFNERAKDKNYEQYDKDTYQFWYNRWRKLKSGKNANLNAAAFKAELDIFRDEAVKRKEALKEASTADRAKLSADFISWLLQQRDKADDLIDTLTDT